MWLIYVFIQHTNNKTGFSQTTSFVYQFSVVWSLSKFIERDCFIRQRVVQNVIWVAQYFLKQFFITVCAVTMGCQHCWANGFFGSLSCLTNKYACLLARSTNSAMVGTSPERKPDRLPRRRTAYMRWRSAAEASPTRKLVCTCIFLHGTYSAASSSIMTNCFTREDRRRRMTGRLL